MANINKYIKSLLHPAGGHQGCLNSKKGLVSTLVIHSPGAWRVIRGKLISCMIKHGHCAGETLLSTIVSLQKDARGNSCCSDNYRGIALTCAINKVVDWAILLKYKGNLRSSELQFVYKKGHSTIMCTLALKKVVNYHTSRKGLVYCAPLDASKAFDRVRFDKLFETLIKRDIPSSIIRLLLNMHQRQKVRTLWDGCLSGTFLTVNGVRQGGVLSPVLFTLYMDMLFTRSEDSGVGCYLGHAFMGALGYADDGTTLAPTVSSFTAMLRICEEFGEEYGVTYDGKKTVCLCFSGRHHIDSPSVTLNDVQLVWKSSTKHLGNIITTDLCDDEEIRFKKRDFVARANIVVCNFKLASREVNGYSLLNVAICMVAKHGVSKQKRCLSLMSAGVKQSASSGICLTPQGQGFCQGLSGQPHCVTRSCVDLQIFIMEFHKVRTIK